VPLGLFVSPTTGIVYVAELQGNKILEFQPTTGQMTEYALPELAQYPAVIRAERDGHIYFSLFIGNGIGRMNVDTHEIELYHTNQTLLLGSEDTIDQYGGVWLSSFTTDVMSRLDTNTLEFSYVAFPNTFAQVNPSAFSGIFGDVPPVVDIAVNYAPGNKIWFTGLTFNQVGSYDLTGLYD
jgi:streptogramin lyase